MNRRISRERAIQALYSLEINDMEVNELIEDILMENEEPSDFLIELVTGVVNNLESIDELLINNLANWKLDRIGKVERAILRLAVYEMKYMNDMPVNVTLNEAIELAKTYCDESSSKFINGVLSKIM
ncbi:MAG: utilization substance protein [Bacillales bacterium]|jgi:N utilization substance protein B|nr:utilization substance protein [Bacillales bacterium]